MATYLTVTSFYDCLYTVQEWKDYPPSARAILYLVDTAQNITDNLALTSTLGDKVQVAEYVVGFNDRGTIYSTWYEYYGNTSQIQVWRGSQNPSIQATANISAQDFNTYNSFVYNTLWLNRQITFNVANFSVGDFVKWRSFYVVETASIRDSSSNFFNNISAINMFGNKVTSISFSDATPPTLAFTSGDYTTYSALLNKILTPFALTINGADVSETISGTVRDDTINGYSGDDSIFGGVGADNLSGGIGNDYIDGGSGTDRLDGGVGDDILIGGDANDIIRGGAGIDTAFLNGNYSDYTFVFSASGIMVQKLDTLELDDILGVEILNFSDRVVSIVQASLADSNPSENAISDKALLGTAIGITATAFTADGSNLGIIYSIVTDESGTTVDASSAFSIGATTGVVALRSSALLDFNNLVEVPIFIRAALSDGTSGVQRFLIQLLNTNDPPVISSNSGGAAASLSISENGTAVTTVTATDPDANTILTYSIVGGADAARFTINSSTGALMFVSAPNFEAPLDVGENNVYDVIVRASDGSLADTQEIAITVLNQSPETVVGTIGDDEFLAGTDREAFDGRAGSDTVSYRAATAGVVASLTNPASNTGFALGDTYVSIENLTGSNFNDTLTGDAGDNALTGGLGNDVLSGGGGNDLIVSDGGNDRVDGGDGVDTLRLDLPLANISRIGAAQNGQVIILETTSGVEILTTSIESFVFSDQFLSSTALLGAIPPTELMATSGGFILPDVFPGDPALNLQTQYLGTGTGEIVSGTSANDFMNLAGGDDAADGRGGNDVLDGGIGSNFLTGGPGSDTFFLDGRGGTTTWSTITDFTSGEDKVNVWGWQQGVSKLLLSLNNSGAAGYTGATYHYDLDGNNSIDTSITFSGRTLADIQSPTVNQVAENQYLLFL